MKRKGGEERWDRTDGEEKKMTTDEREDAGDTVAAEKGNAVERRMMIKVKS